MSLPTMLSKTLIIGILMPLIWLAFAMSGSPVGGSIGLIVAFVIGSLLFKWWVLEK